MRSLIVLALAGVAFALALVMPHREAARRLQFEEAARERLLEELATPGGRNEWEEGGYRFRWLRGKGRTALLVAEPLHPEEEGVRTFASADGEILFELDPVTGSAVAARDPADRLQRILSLPEDQQREHIARTAWVPSVLPKSK